MKNLDTSIEVSEMMELQPVGVSGISTSAMAEFYAGMRCMESGQAGAAVESLTRCVEQAPAFPAGHLCLGVAHAVSCNVYPAIDHLEKAIELEPQSFAANYTMAQFYFKLRVTNRGYEYAERALDCAQTSQQRKALAELLKTERQHERNGMSRPWFNREFGFGFKLGAAAALATAVIAVVTHLH